MKQQILHQYKSRRNCVRLIKTADGVFVQKTYQQEHAYLQEKLIYRKLQGTEIPRAEVISTKDQMLLLSLLPGKNLVEILEHQESTGVVEWIVWEKLVIWLVDFYHLTGHIMTDVNLRNFLYDAPMQTLYGLDFEGCTQGDPVFMASLLAAYIRTYAPQNTSLKLEIAEYVLRRFSGECSVELQTLFLETQKQEALLERRRKSRT